MASVFLRFGQLFLIILVKSAVSQTIGTLSAPRAPIGYDCYEGPCYQRAPFLVGQNPLPYNPNPPGVIITQQQPIISSPIEVSPPQPQIPQNPNPNPNPNPDPIPPVTFGRDITTTTTTTTTESPAGPRCPMPGDICSDDISRDLRCCDGGKQGSARCDYSGYDGNGNRVGKCCIRNEKFGCNRDSDCCATSRICNNGQCLRPSEVPAKSESMFSNFGSMDNHYYFEKNELKEITTSKYFEMSAIILAWICNLCVIWCCYKKYMVKDDMMSCNDNVHGKVLNINIDKKNDESCFTVSNDDGMDDIIDSEREITSSSSSSDNDIA